MDVLTYCGEIRLFAGYKVPTGGMIQPDKDNWAICDGRLLPIFQYELLFSRIGTTYGGDGNTHFALPNLQGKVPVHIGNKAATQPLFLGQSAGLEKTPLTEQHLPVHGHRIQATTAAADTNTAKNNFLSDTSALSIYAAGTDSNRKIMSDKSVAKSGEEGASVSVVQNYLPINYIIALDGL